MGLTQSLPADARDEVVRLLKSEQLPSNIDVIDRSGAAGRRLVIIQGPPGITRFARVAQAMERNLGESLPDILVSVAATVKMLPAFGRIFQILAENKADSPERIRIVCDSLTQQATKLAVLRRERNFQQGREFAVETDDADEIKALVEEAQQEHKYRVTLIRPLLAHTQRALLAASQRCGSGGGSGGGTGSSTDADRVLVYSGSALRGSKKTGDRSLILR